MRCSPLLTKETNTINNAYPTVNRVGNVHLDILQKMLESPTFGVMLHRVSVISRHSFYILIISFIFFFVNIKIFLSTILSTKHLSVKSIIIIDDAFYGCRSIKKKIKQRPFSTDTCILHLQGNRNNIFDKGDNVYLHDLRNDTDNGVRRGVLYFYNTSRDVKLIRKDVSLVEKWHLYNQGRNVSANG